MAAVAESVARFMDITGAEATYAITLLSDHGGDLDLSLASHFAMQEAAEGGGRGGDSGGGGGGGGGSGGDGMAPPFGRTPTDTVGSVEPWTVDLPSPVLEQAAAAGRSTPHFRQSSAPDRFSGSSATAAAAVPSVPEHPRARFDPFGSAGTPPPPSVHGGGSGADADPTAGDAAMAAALAAEDAAVAAGDADVIDLDSPAAEQSAAAARSPPNDWPSAASERLLASTRAAAVSSHAGLPPVRFGPSGSRATRPPLTVRDGGDVGSDGDPTAGDAAMAAALAAEDAAAAAAAGGGGVAGGAGSESPVRPPIPSVVDRLIDTPPPWAAPSLGGERGLGGLGPFGAWGEGGLGGSPFPMAPPPPASPFVADVAFVGTFDEAMQFAKAVSKWLLVNVQSADTPASDALNREVWGRPATRDLLDTSYVLWQVDATSSDGIRYLTYYPSGIPPVVAVVDPRSGERLRSWDASGPAGSAALTEASLVPELRDWAADHVLSGSSLNGGSSGGGDSGSGGGGGGGEAALAGDAALAAALAASLEDAHAPPPPPAGASSSSPQPRRAAPANSLVAAGAPARPRASPLAPAVTAASPRLASPPAPVTADGSSSSPLTAAATAVDPSAAVTAAVAPSSATSVTAAADMAHAAAVAAGARGTPVRLAVRLPGGGRPVTRTWGTADTVGDVRRWVAAEVAAADPDEPPDGWELASVHPRRVLNEDALTVGAAGLAPSASLVVQRR
ncbi:hypothetical protein MMPV_006661 [Pyropia vietnamensis]